MPYLSAGGSGYFARALIWASRYYPDILIGNQEIEKMDTINRSTNTSTSKWQTEDHSRGYLEGVRGAIPLADRQIEVMLTVIRSFCPDLHCMLDLGCGDGILGRAVLGCFPDVRAIFLDFSTPMIEAAERKIPAGDSVKIVKADYGSPEWLRALDQTSDFDLIVSGFSIHHQPDTRKRALYAEIFNLLSPGGLFLNLEHVASPTRAIQSMFDEYFVDHIFAYHNLSDKTVTREQVAQNYYERSDKKENILASLELQCEWLRKIGFQDVDCFFKIFELALFGGRKAV